LGRELLITPSWEYYKNEDITQEKVFIVNFFTCFLVVGAGYYCGNFHMLGKNSKAKATRGRRVANAVWWSHNEVSRTQLERGVGNGWLQLLPQDLVELGEEEVAMEAV
jgi:hypothetical protein